MGLYSRHVRPRLLDATLGEKVTGEVRDRVCAGLTGDVLEIGYGSGLNQAHLPDAVTGVWAVEPSPAALQLARPRQEASPSRSPSPATTRATCPSPTTGSTPRSAPGCSAASRTRTSHSPRWPGC